MHVRVCWRVHSCVDGTTTMTSAVASCAAESCKGHYTAGILYTEQTRVLNLDKPMMDPRLSAVSTSILLIPTAAPR